jgi:hypothetical protein
MGKANGSRECAPDDKLRVPTKRRVTHQWWARRKSAFAHPTKLHYALAGFWCLAVPVVVGAAAAVMRIDA